MEAFLQMHICYYIPLYVQTSIVISSRPREEYWDHQMYATSACQL